MLASHPTLKKRLENALLFQSSRQVQAQQVAKAKAVADAKVGVVYHSINAHFHVDIQFFFQVVTFHFGRYLLLMV